MKIITYADIVAKCPVLTTQDVYHQQQILIAYMAGRGDAQQESIDRDLTKFVSAYQPQKEEGK
jgi:hypothetical protein